MKLLRCISLIGILLLVGIALPRRTPMSAHSVSRALTQEAYIWQRAWTPGVVAAVQEGAPSFSGYVALAAEVSFRGGRVRVERVTVNYPALARAGVPVGLALRIGAYSGPFGVNDENARLLKDLAASIIAHAKAAGISLSELQLDFDCAESKLDGYRKWVIAIKHRVSPVPVVITALPVWLKRRAFAPLARSADGYVLQVHSLARPTSLDAPMSLCDADAARAAVARAGRVGVPFRVALPTYGYLVAFDPSGRFIGLSAEASARHWSSDASVRALRADPGAIAGLVSGWKRDRPACMIGVIWYRLPAPDDALNWRLSTLRAVMSGQTPVAHLRGVVRQTQRRIYTVELVNEGNADASLATVVRVRGAGAAAIASDALGGFVLDRGRDRDELVFRAGAAVAGQILSPGERVAIGWLRLNEDKEVHADVVTITP